MAIGERELWACAQHFIRRHGRDAGAEADRRARELLAGGDQAGHGIFRLIAERIGKLERTQPTGPLH